MKLYLEIETSEGCHENTCFTPLPVAKRKRLAMHLANHLHKLVQGKVSFHTWSCKRVLSTETFLIMGGIDPDIFGYQWRLDAVHRFPVTVETGRCWTYGEALACLLRSGNYHKHTLTCNAIKAVPVDTNYRQIFARFLARFC